MTLRLTRSVVGEIEKQRRLGRTSSQIEKIVGLARGTLSRGYLIDDSAQQQIEAARAHSLEWRRREERRWAAMATPQRPQGWRPKGNCLTDRPDAGRHFKPRSSN